MRITEIRFDSGLYTLPRRRFIAPIFAPPPPVFTGAGTFTGQGLLIGLGILLNFKACVPDAIPTLYLVPRGFLPTVLMPIAYVTQVNMPGDLVGCTGTTTTAPATGSFNTLVEGNSVPPINQ